jgi:hypothetical protein
MLLNIFNHLNYFMKLLTLEKLRALKDLTKITILLLGLYCPVSWGTESDPYTYSDIPLEDSAAKINSYLQKKIDSVAEETNQVLADRPNISDRHLEFIFMSRYFKQINRTGKSEDLVYSELEQCIDSNQCPGWPYFERIKLYGPESVYAKSKYNPVAAKYLASIIVACGVRFSTDKLTHMLNDGFRFYNATRDGRSKITVSNVELYSNAVERSTLGMSLTGVHSYADVRANMAGVDFFTGLLQGKMANYRRDPQTGLMVNIRNIDICQFVDRKFDETYWPNQYYPVPYNPFYERPRTSFPNDKFYECYMNHKRMVQAKLQRLEQAIAQARQAAQQRENIFSPGEKIKFKESILNRKVADPRISTLTNISGGIKSAIDYLFSAKKHQGLKAYLLKPSLRHRRDLDLLVGE